MKKSAAAVLSCLLATALLPAQGSDGFVFETTTLGGRKLNQKDFANNVLIVDFWATSCPPCERSIPGLVGLYKKYKHHGLEILGLNYEESGSRKEVLDKLRKFASDNGIMYPLAIGTAKIKEQIGEFGGYPTMLFFKRGLELDHTEVGFSPKLLMDMESWIRQQLGLGTGPAKDAQEDEPGAKGRKEEGGPEEEQPETEEKDRKASKSKIPEGVIYRPGNHDSGFQFSERGIDGAKIEFTDFRGKKVLLALTSTWDQEAKNTAAILKDMHKRYAGKGVVVVAASLEMDKARDAKIVKIRAFIKEHGIEYTVVPVGIGILKKIHQPSGVPLYLVFDEKGVLILRKRNNTRERIVKEIDEALGSAEEKKEEGRKDAK